MFFKRNYHNKYTKYVTGVVILLHKNKYIYLFKKQPIYKRIFLSIIKINIAYFKDDPFNLKRICTFNTINQYSIQYNFF
jgi:hypothetical protein